MIDEPHVLVFGSSANPIHQGHVHLLRSAVSSLNARRFRVERVIIVPVYRRSAVGKRKDELPETFEHRLAMCELVVADLYDTFARLGTVVETSRIEEELARGRAEPNRTLETLLLLKERYAQLKLCFLLSGDIVSGPEPELARWHRPEELARQATLVICTRPGYPWNEEFLTNFEKQGAHLVCLNDTHCMDVSSSSIRSRIADGEDPTVLSSEGVLPQSVAAYIKNHDLYRTL